jgi:hypothetical protein
MFDGFYDTVDENEEEEGTHDFSDGRGAAQRPRISPIL